MVPGDFFAQQTRRAAVIPLILALALQAPALDPHYDQSKPVELCGVISSITWADTVRIEFDTEALEGRPATRWALTTPSANSLLRAGLRRDDLRPATKAFITVYPVKHDDCASGCKGLVKNVRLRVFNWVGMSSFGTGPRPPMEELCNGTRRLAVELRPQVVDPGDQGEK
jgi:hypothetical protein